MWEAGTEELWEEDESLSVVHEKNTHRVTSLVAPGNNVFTMLTVQRWRGDAYEGRQLYRQQQHESKARTTQSSYIHFSTPSQRKHGPSEGFYFKSCYIQAYFFLVYFILTWFSTQEEVSLYSWMTFVRYRNLKIKCHKWIQRDCAKTRRTDVKRWSFPQQIYCAPLCPVVWLVEVSPSGRWAGSASGSGMSRSIFDSQGLLG